MSIKDKTCCFTGHRILAGRDILTLPDTLKKTLRALIAEGYLYFGAGGALGFDTLAAEAVLALREEFPQIKLILVLPCENQTEKWREADKVRYKRILERADKCVYTSRQYTADCMLKRNRHLVDESSVCIAYLNQAGRGGTAYTVRYAQKSGLRIINLGTEEV